MKLYLILPLTSVECERIFSEVTNTVTENRNCLKVDKLDKLLMISRNGIERKNFEFIRAFNYWREGRKRYYLN